KEAFRMAVVSMMKMSGDPDELAAKVREHLAPVGRELAPGHGGLGTIVARTDDGIMVINLWENEEGRHAMAEEPRVQEAVANSGPGRLHGAEPAAGRGLDGLLRELLLSLRHLRLHLLRLLEQLVHVEALAHSSTSRASKVSLTSATRSSSLAAGSSSCACAPFSPTTNSSVRCLPVTS